MDCQTTFRHSNTLCASAKNLMMGSDICHSTKTSKRGSELDLTRNSSGSYSQQDMNGQLQMIDDFVFDERDENDSESDSDCKDPMDRIKELFCLWANVGEGKLANDLCMLKKFIDPQFMKNQYEQVGLDKENQSMYELICYLI